MQPLQNHTLGAQPTQRERVLVSSTTRQKTFPRPQPRNHPSICLTTPPPISLPPGCLHRFVFDVHSHSVRFAIADSEPRQCYKSFVGVKVIKRLELLQRETRLDGKALPTKPQRYLLALEPGGVSSTVLLHSLWENLQQQRQRKQRIRFEVLVAVVRTGSAGGGDGAGNNALDECRKRFEGFEFRELGFEGVLGLDTVDWTALPKLDASLPPSQRLMDFFARLPSVSSQADVTRLFIRHLLINTAVRESCDVLLMGYNTTSLAELTLSETAKGRGFAVPWGVNDGIFTLPRISQPDPTVPADGEFNDHNEITIPIYHPLRELFRKELLIYSNVAEPPLTPLLLSNHSKPSAAVVSHKDLSIDNVMARYFAEVEENYPSVVANVVRTTGKLNRSGRAEAGSCGLCSIGLDEVGDERWRGELGEPVQERSEKGKLCYGCERTVYG